MSEQKLTFNVSLKTKLYGKFMRRLPSQEGKIVVITGTTSGTGFVAAKSALVKGATVCMLNRNVQKAEKAMAPVFEDGGLKERAHFVECDLQDFENVDKAAKEVIEKFPDGIDVLCNNAGVMALKDMATKDGYDVQAQTNHLSHFKLTQMLFPLLEKKGEAGGDPRVVNHSSMSRLGFSSLKAKYFEKNGGNLGGDKLPGQFSGPRWERYHQSKLANSVFTLELTKRAKAAKSKVKCYCAHPGFAATDLQLTTSADGGINHHGIFMRYAQTGEDGALGIMKGMFFDSRRLTNGAIYGPRFFTGNPGKRFHGMMSTSHAGKLLWKVSEKATGKFVISLI